MTTKVDATKLLLITFACVVFAVTCAVVVWKVKPEEPKSKTEVDRVKRGDALLWAGSESGCFSDTAWTELESWTELSLKKVFNSDQDKAFRDSSNSGQRLNDKPAVFKSDQDNVFRDSSNSAQRLNDKPADHRVLFSYFSVASPFWAPWFTAAYSHLISLSYYEDYDSPFSVRRKLYHGQLELDLSDFFDTQETSDMAPLVINVGHGYENETLGVSFSYLQSSDPLCDTTQIYLVVF